MSAVMVETQSGERTVVSLDAISTQVPLPPHLPDLIATCSDLVCSNDFRVPGTGSASATLSELASSGRRRVVMTGGAEPVRWRDDHGSGQVVVPSVPVVDTLGAGRAWLQQMTHWRHG